MHPCVLAGNNLCQPTELSFFESLSEHTDSGAINPDGLKQDVWSIGEQINAPLVTRPTWICLSLVVKMWRAYLKK